MKLIDKLYQYYFCFFLGLCSIYCLILQDQRLTIASLVVSIISLVPLRYNLRNPISILQYLGLLLIGCLFGYCIANGYEPFSYINIKFIFIPVFIYVFAYSIIRLIRFINREESSEE